MPALALLAEQATRDQFVQVLGGGRGCHPGVRGLVLLGPFVRNPPSSPLAALAFRVVFRLGLLRPWGPAVWRSFILSYCGPDGTLDVPSLREDLEIYRKIGLIEVPVTIEQIIDTSFAQWAVKELGPYVKQ